MSASSFKSHSTGSITAWQKTPSGITGKTTNSLFKLEFYTDTLVRIVATRNEVFNDHSYAVVAKPAPVSFHAEEHDQHLIITTNALRIVIDKQSFTFSFQTPDGKIINEDDNLGIRWNNSQVTAYKKLQEDERFIGLGEKNGPLDRRGRGYINWNTDSYGYTPDTDPLYCTIPFYMGVHHNMVYGLFFDNSARTQFNFGASNNRFASFAADMGDMNYYFIGGQTVSDILNAYSLLTGYMPLPPLWSIGYQQCRYSYYPDREVISVAENLRARDFPADAIVLDIHYMDKYKIFTWDPVNFPDPKAMMDTLKTKGFEVVVMCDPGIKIEDGYPAYESGKKENVFIQYPDGVNYAGEVWPGWCHFPDFTKPETRAWWAKQFKDYVDLGVEGFWNDMNEIATWGNMLPDVIEFNMEGRESTALEGRNVFGSMMAYSTYEGVKELMNKRPFTLTRAAYAGAQRYTAVWTGDNVAYDAHMMAGVRLVNNMGLSGLPFTGYDIGGFVGNADEKLFARWMAIGAFSPFFRGHSMINSRDSEPWSYGEKVEEISRNFMKLRYRLLPYLYSVFYEASQNGLPVNRSLAINYTFDALVYDHRYHNQYLFGSSILVAPVESNKDLVKVYLPEGNWYELFTDKPFSGNQEIVADCPMEQLPVYVKGSAIIPMREKAGENTRDTGDVLEIHLYKGTTPNNFELYEDDGTTFAHEQGVFAKRMLTYSPDHNTLTISQCEGSYSSNFKKLNIFFHGFTEMQSVTVNAKPYYPETRTYRFVQPISNFDPVGTMPEGLKINSLNFISTEYSQDQLEINWTG